jgi:hypothetical protein
MAIKSTQKRWKTPVETPSAPSPAPSTYLLRLLPSAGRGLKKVYLCRCTAEVWHGLSAAFFRQRSGHAKCTKTGSFVPKCSFSRKLSLKIHLTYLIAIVYKCFFEGAGEGAEPTFATGKRQLLLAARATVSPRNALTFANVILSFASDAAQLQCETVPPY